MNVWRAFIDERTCEACRAVHDRSVDLASPPVCSNPDGCRCVVVKETLSIHVEPVDRDRVEPTIRLNGVPLDAWGRIDRVPGFTLDPSGVLVLRTDEWVRVFHPSIFRIEITFDRSPVV